MKRVPVGSNLDGVTASWVNDSEPEPEFQETVNKSDGVLKDVAMAEQFGSEQRQ